MYMAAYIPTYTHLRVCISALIIFRIGGTVRAGEILGEGNYFNWEFAH